MSHSQAAESKGAAAHAGGKAVNNWDDPSIPAGNAPPMPRWPLVASAVAFGLWLLFLVAMAYLRVRTTPV